MAQQAAARKQEAFTEQRIGNEPVLAMSSTSATQTADHFVVRDGLQFAGTHLLIDLWGASRLDDLAHVEAMLTEAVDAVGATLLNIDLHHFQPEGGISGVAILAESHMSIHTWPERGFAAIDIFVCGACNAHAAVAVLRRAFLPAQVTLTEHKRGLVP